MVRRKGFTLIELLVVLSIITLLMSVLMPSLQKARLAAEEVVCRSNLKQYGLVGALYLEDYDYIFPDAWNSIFNSRENFTQCQWHDESRHPDLRSDLKGFLWNYFGGFSKVHYCRTFARLAKTGKPHRGHTDSIPIVPLFCYSMNAFLGGFEEWRGGHRLLVASSQVRRPAEIFFFAEENCWPYEPDPSHPKGRFYRRYLDTLNDNALCGAPKLPSDPAAWEYPRDQGPPYLDAFGSYHKTTTRRRNKGMANATFVDGHVQLVDPEHTYYYTKPMNRQPPLR